MSHDEHPNPNPHDDPTARPLLIGTAVGVVVFVASFMALVAFYERQEPEFEREAYYEQPVVKVLQSRAEQETNIGSFGKNQETGELLIPIDRAMRIVARELTEEQADTRP